MFILELYTPLLCSQFGQTPLHIAAGSGNYEIVKILVNANSDVKATSKVQSAKHSLVQCLQGEHVKYESRYICGFLLGKLTR